MRLPILVAAATALAACVGPVLSDPAIEGTDWYLVGLEGQETGWSASIRFDGDSVTGRAPCNRFFTENSSALPSVTLGPIGSTKMACDKLAEEQVFFEALRAMQRAELDQDHLYLTGPEGRIMEFAKDAGEPCLSCLARQ